MTNTQQLGVKFVSSLMPGFNNRAMRRVCMKIPALAGKTRAAAPEGSMFRSFLRDIGFGAFANQQAQDHAHHEFQRVARGQRNRTVITSPTTQDTSASRNKYT
jgi:hypothetical protein